jgi:7,8-dihydropterin-6-yl-methyl-4-(beta-D-ribofuranosyl)aminobenzene 5'-phosphate synthase
MKICLVLFLLCVLFCFAGTAEPITITVVYNNVPYDEDLTTSWGLSMFIQGLEDTILFDTGGDGSILLSNMEKLEINPQTIETVVLSHIHTDHIGGLATLLEENNRVTVYLPSSFPANITKSITDMAKEVVTVDKPQEICAQVWSTGELGTSIKEQSLIIATDKGLIIITGCAHPGIVNIVESAKEYLNQDVYLVAGGFHLMFYKESEVNEIIKELKSLGVKKISPSHCTGGRPIELFKAAWNENFIDLGCGAKINIPIFDFKKGE